MSFDFLFSHLRSAAAGFFLGLLTAAWLHATWQRWHPATIRFWGTWYTDPRLLLVTGVGLAIAWLGMLISAY